ncbi:hemolysin [Rhodobacterales bacterium HKCCE4037]|nr:hemolysin [Rhodobacterales bacterium HKCCE4037]
MANGNLLGFVDSASGPELDDGEFDEGDIINIGGTNYTIDLIQEPSSSGSFLLGNGSTAGFGAKSESNLDVMFLTVSDGVTTRYFILPNDSYGDFNIQSVTTGGINDVAGNDAAVIGTTDNETNIVCFAEGTLIETMSGKMVPVERLAVGDLVRTLDHGGQPIRWIGRAHLSAERLDASPHLRPIRIAAGALGPGRPSTDLVVSPQHRLLVTSKIAQRMFGEAEVLASAKSLLQLPMVEVEPTSESGVRYFHLLLDNHEILFANGAQAESLYLGEQALQTLSRAARREIQEIFPGFIGAEVLPPSARLFAPVQKGRTLAMRHAKNGHDVQPAAELSEKASLAS